MSDPVPFAVPAAEVVRELAVRESVCVRPVLHRVTDTVTGVVEAVPVPCGATLAASCPPCADRNRRVRMQQCREGWHLAEEPSRPPVVRQRNDDAGPRQQRSTKRRQDVPDLPRLPVASRTVGQTFTATDGKTWRPSTFLTVTLPSYGRVRSDGTPIDPEGYDYRRAALDALHLPKLFDRLVQNLRRAVGYDVQYFAVVEPQRRLAPHLHIAIRGAIPRALLRAVVAATYHQLWWPPHDHPVYGDGQAPVWSTAAGGYLDPVHGGVLPSWEEAQAAIDADTHTGPAYVIRFGSQVDVQGLIAGNPACDRAIGYLTKYLSKAIAEGIGDADPTARQARHADRLHDQVRELPCSPSCANWLAYGITPKNAEPGMRPGQCGRRAHHRERLGCGGRRVLVSRKWTGKTLDAHRADRAQFVRDTLAALGQTVPTGYSATTLRPDGHPRYRWERTSITSEDDATDYLTAIALAIDQRRRWRTEYQQAQRHQTRNSAMGEMAA